MEIIRKTIMRAITTGKTETCNENCFVFVPDLTAKYHFKLLLTNQVKDVGFFSVENFPYDNNIIYGSTKYLYVNDDENVSVGIGESLLMDDTFI